MDDHVEAIDYSKVLNFSQKDVVQCPQQQALKAEAKVLELQTMLKQRDSALTAAKSHLDFLIQVKQGTKQALREVTQQLQHSLNTFIVLEADLKIANAKLELSERTVAELCSSREKEILILEDLFDASEPISDIFYLPVPRIGDNSHLFGTSCDYLRFQFGHSPHLELEKVQQGFLHDDYFSGDVWEEVADVADPKMTAKQCCLDLNLLDEDQFIREGQSAGNIRGIMELDEQFQMLQQSFISELSKGTGGANVGVMQYYLGISNAENLIGHFWFFSKQRRAFFNRIT